MVLTILGLSAIAITINTGDVIQNIYYYKQQELERSDFVPKTEEERDHQRSNVIEVDFKNEPKLNCSSFIALILFY